MVAAVLKVALARAILAPLFLIIMICIESESALIPLSRFLSERRFAGEMLIGRNDGCSPGSAFMNPVSKTFVWRTVTAWCGGTSHFLTRIKLKKSGRNTPLSFICKGITQRAPAANRRQPQVVSKEPLGAFYGN